MLPDDLRLITLKYDSDCDACGTTLHAGEQAYWSPSARGQAWCQTCGPTPRAPATGMDDADPRKTRRHGLRRSNRRVAPDSHDAWSRLCRYLSKCVLAESANTLVMFQDLSSHRCSWCRFAQSSVTASGLAKRNPNRSSIWQSWLANSSTCPPRRRSTRSWVRACRSEMPLPSCIWRETSPGCSTSVSCPISIHDRSTASAMSRRACTTPPCGFWRTMAAARPNPSGTSSTSWRVDRTGRPLRRPVSCPIDRILRNAQVHPRRTRWPLRSRATDLRNQPSTGSGANCQGRTKTRPEWRRKIRPSGRPVACLKVAVRVG